MNGLPQILLGYLKFRHNLRVLHGTEQGTERFTRLKVYRTIFHLYNHVFTELPIERHKLLVCLTCPVGT